MATKRRAFVASLQQDGLGHIPLPKDVARYFSRVLRLEAGTSIELFDGSGQIATGTMGLEPQSHLADVRIAVAPTVLPPLVLAQANVRQSKLDDVVRRATELGASEVICFAAARSQGGQGKMRVDRLERIVQEAARQSLRCMAPQVRGPLSFTDLLSVAQAFAGVVCMGLVDSDGPLSEVLSREKEGLREHGLMVVIGPEGGLSPEEEQLLLEVGVKPVALGAHVLRTETAGLAALAAAQMVLGTL